ncbi:right-handed parallel beta-helix repeat-containing protein [Fimbriiglobus ruber]|uniref:Right handed beta helix domain-containing protein n=1 Tax=Fimbriiglobus ruber TaxID=1908690 RepID=A0A225DDJ9_9BACT|nr:right-handed parallel beta-helix repeat-containing protein [Fimbriiglobus ruber]OWK34485.1 hypothetical protein FRUB_10456 [Fimbriiglobus ruber]
MTSRTYGAIAVSAAVLAISAIGAARFTRPDEKTGIALVGDGTTDNTAAIQTAVDTGNGGVTFPKGVFRITKPIVIDLDKVGYTAFTATGAATLKMDGPGPALRFIGTHEGTASPPTFKPNVWDRQRTPHVDGLEIIGTHPEADGIEASGTMQLTVSGATLRKLRHGVHLVKRNRNVLISACHIYENRGAGVYLDDVNLHQTNVVGCHISYCDGGGVVTRGGEVRNLHIGTCDIEGCMAKGGPPGANVLIDCAGGSTAEVAITGCTIQHSNVPDAANVRVLGAGVGIQKGTTAQWGHVTIGNNVFSDVAVNVDLKDCRGVTLTGNTFWMAYTHNLRVENCQQVVVGPNAFERNPAYDYGTSKSTVNAIHFKNCRDCTLTGLHIHGTHTAEAGVTLDGCARFNVTGCSILDCEGIGLLLRNPENCRISDCLIRHDGQRSKEALSLKVVGGKGNLFANNLIGNGAEVPRDSGEWK